MSHAGEKFHGKSGSGATAFFRKNDGKSCAKNFSAGDSRKGWAAVAKNGEETASYMALLQPIWPAWPGSPYLALCHRTHADFLASARDGKMKIHHLRLTM